MERQIPSLTFDACKRLELFRFVVGRRVPFSVCAALAGNWVVRTASKRTGNTDTKTLLVVTLMEASTRCSAALPETPYAFAMVKSNAQRQAEYQRRQQEAGSYRLDAYISPDAHAALQQVVQRDGISRKDAIERSILNEAKGHNMKTQFRTDDPATDPGGKRNDSKPALATIRLTASEVAPRKPVSKPATPRKDVSPMTTTTAPARPSEMTVAEHQELEQFKASLPNAIISAELDARHVQANGGAAAMSQKERVTAMLQANNQHFKK